jgi:hypothetical protein
LATEPVPRSIEATSGAEPLALFAISIVARLQRVLAPRPTWPNFWTPGSSKLDDQKRCGGAFAWRADIHSDSQLPINPSIIDLAQRARSQMRANTYRAKPARLFHSLCRDVASTTQQEINTDRPNER